MRTVLFLSLLILRNACLAKAHGYVAQVSIDGDIYMGNVPNAEPTPSIVRQINDIAPVKGTSNPYMNCGQAAQLAALVANANPGSQFQFWWKDGDGTNSCVGTTCDNFNSTNAEWFKIEETGLQPGNMTWYQQNIMDGFPANVTLPSNLEPGQYLIRHEIIALHLATELMGAEFYPSCTQVNILGNQTGTPTSSEEVTFPGGYSDTDPGIYDPTVFDTPVQYTFPGPPVATLVASSSSSGSSSSSLPAYSTATPVSSGASTATPTAAGQATCRIQTQQTLAIKKRHPGTLSRIMAVLIKGTHDRG
ncbi:glycoside hydrolase family 61 protein [Pisolithus sp. B1]|nr:glycoside hydrolase family 61 protein [Pisolithus sp. B1]